MRSVSLLGAALAALAFSSGANAASFSNHVQLGCGSYTLAHTLSVDCSTSYMDTSETDVVFGKTGWKLVDLGLDTDAGVWSVAGFGSYSDVMMTIDGDGSYIAGLLDTGFTSGTWSGPSADVGFKLYAIEGVSDVPLPAAGFLMLAALGGLGLVARRRKA
ncbi:MAG: VPLPA-CTERM sorting domain-containing protein [Pseudomonadota bacterium]